MGAIGLVLFGALAGVPDLGWLAGRWCGVAGGIAYEETWTPADADVLLATSRTIRDGRVRGFEFLRIVRSAAETALYAYPGGRSPPTRFALDAATERSIRFANLAHDFPKRIGYRLGDDGALVVRIDDGTDAGRSEELTWRRCDEARVAR